MCKAQIRKRCKRSSGKSNYELVNQADNKQLITDPKGNSEFCFSKITKLTVSCGVIKCFVIPPNSKIEKESGKKHICLTPVGTTNLRRFQCARPDHVRVESSVCFFPLGVSEFCATTRDTFSNREV